MVLNSWFKIVMVRTKLKKIELTATAQRNYRKNCGFKGEARKNTIVLLRKNSIPIRKNNF
jgi:hypothetical protein